jgi:hypothetical protein
MSNLNLRLNTAKTICWVTCLSDALPVTAGTTLTDVTHEGADGAAATGDGVHDNPDNHVLYHDVQDALYRQQGIENMQNISIVPSGALVAASLSAVALEIVDDLTDTVDILYQPGNVVAINADFTYVSSDVTKATVAATGVVTAVAIGECVITFTHKHTGMVGTCAIEVVAA